MSIKCYQFMTLTHSGSMQTESHREAHRDWQSDTVTVFSQLCFNYIRVW